MITLAKLSGKERILDLGTGSGPIAIGFAKRIFGGSVYGVDKFSMDKNNFMKIIDIIRFNYFGNDLDSAVMNAKLENVSDRCFFLQADLTKKIKFDDGFFDVIVSSQTLPFLSKATNYNIMNEINRVLKVGGCIIFFESKSYKEWNIKNIESYFKKKGYYVKISPTNEFIGSCLLYGKKNA
jgi:ubiquinone/menaquinone biosynthesis C-methylase UbiE